MPRRRLLTVLVGLSLVALCDSCAASPVRSAAGRVQPVAPQPALFDPAIHMRTADVRIGMTGHGLSVFKGTEIERFEVEVLAILRNSEQIDTNVILIRASGAGLEHTGPVQGMSGSPIYLRCEDGKERLLGAFAFGWAGAKDPIVGVQPIEAMLRLDSTPHALADDAHAAAAVPAASTEWNARFRSAMADPSGERQRPFAESTGLARPSASLMRQQDAGLRPLSLPVSMSGFAPEVAKELARALAAGGIDAMRPAQLAGPVTDADRIEPGSPLIVPLLIGDFNLIATGTCTAVIGERVFGLGHPMFGEGPSRLPIAAGKIEAVIPTQTISFKLGSPGKILGTLATDAAAGVAGTLGQSPPMIPITIRVKRGPQSQSFRFQAAQHPLVTSVALAAAAENAVALQGQPETHGATRWNVTLRYSGGRTLRLRDVAANTITNPFQAGGLSNALALPLQLIQENPFGRVELESMDADVELLPAATAELATLETINVRRRQYRAGEVVTVDLVFRRYRGGRVARTVELALPDDLPPGQYPLSVSDAAGALSDAAVSRPFEFDVKSVDDLFAVLNSLQTYPADAAYVRIDQPEQMHVAVGREALPDLPNSRALLLAESGRSDVKTYGPALSRKIDLPFVLTEGQAQAVITVMRR